MKKELQQKETSKLKIVYVPISSLRASKYNPRKISKESMTQLKESLKKFELVDPLIVNCTPGRNGIVIGGHMRLKAAVDLGFKEVPVVYINIPDIEKEKELNIRLNKNTGEFDWNLLANFDETFLKDAGFSSEELDEVFGIDENPEIFDLAKELAKLDIKKIEVKKGDIYQLGNHRMRCGDSTIGKDILNLMNGEKASMCFTDMPYFLDYLHGKKKRGKATTGFGYKRDRRYLETESLPPDFMAKWMASVSKVQKEDFSIISFENWKNLPLMWQEMSRHWKIRNLIIWNTPNRVQGFAAKYKFFNKYDIALLGSSGKPEVNLKMEGELLDNEYEAALYATSGKPHFENYEKGKKICPTDFVSFRTADEKNSGQGIIFGTKPVEILIPYIKILTKRNDLIIEPFGGSGSTLIAAEKMKMLSDGKISRVLRGHKASMGKINWPKSKKDMKRDKLKDAVIKALKEMPVIQIACKRAGVSRATYYRWRTEDEDFLQQSNEAANEGREFICDMSESQIIKSIQEGKLPACTLWLKHNSPRYGADTTSRGPISPIVELTPEEEKLFEKALGLSSKKIKQKNYDRENQSRRSAKDTR